MALPKNIFNLCVLNDAYRGFIKNYYKLGLAYESKKHFSLAGKYFKQAVVLLEFMDCMKFLFKTTDKYNNFYQ